MSSLALPNENNVRIKTTGATPEHPSYMSPHVTELGKNLYFQIKKVSNIPIYWNESVK